jgi:hypothetical protein
MATPQAAGGGKLRVSQLLPPDNMPFTLGLTIFLFMRGFVSPLVFWACTQVSTANVKTAKYIFFISIVLATQYFKTVPRATRFTPPKNFTKLFKKGFLDYRRKRVQAFAGV